jgi:myo-inositol-1(or 4)-monophosphatase
VIDAAELQQRRRVAEEAARAAGAVHLRYFGSSLERELHQGNSADYTTVADLEAQAAVKATIARHFPDEIVVGEEDIELRIRVGELFEGGCWLTDPLDGTQEFAHGNPAVSCIVGYVRGGEPKAGAAYFAVWDELFSAAEGQGATLNSAPISVSAVTQLDAALFAAPQVSTSNPERAAAFVQRVSTVLPRVEGFRMPGAQSYMVCGVAAGRYDITAVISPRVDPRPDKPYFGAPWETIALALIVREAGGVVCNLNGGSLDLLGYNAYAASQPLLDQFVSLMRFPS